MHLTCGESHLDRYNVVDSSVEVATETDHSHVESHDPSHYLLSELDDQRQLVGLDKSQEVFFG